MRLPKHVNLLGFMLMASIPIASLGMLCFGLMTGTVLAGLGLVALATSSIVLLAFTLSPRSLTEEAAESSSVQIHQQVRGLGDHPAVKVRI
jgi:hypothetical protein